MDSELRKRVDVREAALIVVDVQNDFCHSEGVLAKRGADIALIQEMASNLVSLIGEARTFSLPIIYIRNHHDHWTDSPSWKKRQQGKGLAICRTGSWGAEFYKVSPLPEERVITKHRYSAFIGTDLDLILRSRGIRSLLLTGVATNVCVESTAREAFMRDYQLVLIKDCLAAMSLEEHMSSLKTLEKSFDAMVVDSDQVVKVWKEEVETRFLSLAK